MGVVGVFKKRIGIGEDGIVVPFLEFEGR